jgi:hypothetical protein
MMIAIVIGGTVMMSMFAQAFVSISEAASSQDVSTNRPLP